NSMFVNAPPFSHGIHRALILMLDMSLHYWHRLAEPSLTRFWSRTVTLFRRVASWTLLVLLGLPLAVDAEQFRPSLYAEMRWRMIGPIRGGRTVAATGVPGQPNVFYVAANNGGVWKTNDYGHTWKPIFDDQPTGSVGALAVAASNPDIIYVGSGEGLQR